MFDKLSLRGLLLGTGGVMLLALLTVSLLGFLGLRQVSTAAGDMGLGKDVVADILPPPLYVIEAQLTASDLLHGDPAERLSLVAKLKQLRKDYDDRNAYWQQVEMDSTIRSSLLGEQKRQADSYWGALDRQFLPAIESGNRAAAESAFLILRKAYLAHRQGVDATVEVANTFAGKTLKDLDERANQAKLTIVGVSAFGILTALLAIAVLLRQIGLRVGGEPAVAMGITQRIANGNLVNEGMTGRQGIMGALEGMRQKLQLLVGEVARHGHSLSESAPRLLDRAGCAQNSAQKQASSASEIAAAVEELSSSIAQAAENARIAESLVAAAGNIATTGNTLVSDAVAQMRIVAHSVQESVASVTELSKKSSEIGRIVDVIREVADQTNLLALNAAIEAARAGESGRGFAVVADEVRKLAERTTRSTAEIAEMVKQIQQGMGGVTAGIEEAAVQAVGAATSGQSAAGTMGEIDVAVKSALSCVRDVAAALAEQDQAAQQVAGSVEVIAREAEGTAERAKVNAEEAKHLVHLSDDLYGLTKQFRY
jgi:methyl-accepting chemotaxis protein